jgi:hypothetical protein
LIFKENACGIFQNPAADMKNIQPTNIKTVVPAKKSAFRVLTQKVCPSVIANKRSLRSNPIILQNNRSSSVIASEAKQSIFMPTCGLATCKGSLLQKISAQTVLFYPMDCFVVSLLAMTEKEGECSL